MDIADKKNHILQPLPYINTFILFSQQMLEPILDLNLNQCIQTSSTTLINYQKWNSLNKLSNICCVASLAAEYL